MLLQLTQTSQQPLSFGSKKLLSKEKQQIGSLRGVDFAF
jgi:hypothetical protein